jgi:hypothetical protein
MRKAMIVTLGLLPFLSGITFGQAPETTPKTGYGYAFSSRRSRCRRGQPYHQHWRRRRGSHQRRIGASVDLSYLFFLEVDCAGFGMFSPGMVYQFKTNRTTVPFVSGGYTLAFRQGTENLVYGGGGFNHWFSNRWGLRFEVRDQIAPRDPEYNFLQFRIGFLFR